MIELGRKQILYIDHRADFGVYLCEAKDLGRRDGECIQIGRAHV